MNLIKIFNPTLTKLAIAVAIFICTRFMVGALAIFALMDVQSDSILKPIIVMFFMFTFESAAGLIIFPLVSYLIACVAVSLFTKNKKV